MKAIVVIYKGYTYAAVSTSKRKLDTWKADLVGDGPCIWRYHDGSGWADGSDEAWRHIQSVPAAVVLW